MPRNRLVQIRDRLLAHTETLQLHTNLPVLLQIRMEGDPHFDHQNGTEPDKSLRYTNMTSILSGLMGPVDPHYAIENFSGSSLRCINILNHEESLKI